MTNKIIIIDLEATCWEGIPPKGEVSEIIEIGICLLDTLTGEISDNRGINEYINVKELFQEVTQHPKRLGMHQALNYLKIPLVGTHHRGKDDAYNIAKIMYKLITNPMELN